MIGQYSKMIAKSNVYLST